MRRVRCDLIDTFKIMMKVGEEDTKKSFSKKRFRLDVRKYVFSNRVVDRWNQLPEKNVINVVTVNTFKKYISIELEPESYSML